jgi:hypothetical protein
MAPLKPSVERYRAALEAEFASNAMVVFLCGPSATRRPEPGAELRVRLQDALTAANFEVVLGEDDGLEHLQKMYGKYAHENERHFVESQAAAVVLVAASIGSFCELGMFADRLVTERNRASKDFILIADAKYEHDPSYFNLGPAKVVQHFWTVHYTDFSTFDVAQVVDRLKGRRSIFKSETRGRPRV